VRRLKLATICAQGPEIPQTARTQRWSVDEVLRTLVAAEISARDRTNQQLRLKAANLPVLKDLETFDAAASSMPMATFNYVASQEWIRAREHLLPVGPAGTGKSHLLVRSGLRAVSRHRPLLPSARARSHRRLTGPPRVGRLSIPQAAIGSKVDRGTSSRRSLAIPSHPLSDCLTVACKEEQSSAFHATR
jgi:hypothetical protein